MRSPSISDSSPTARPLSTTLSNRISRRTYSKRSTVHLQKRKAEAEQLDEDDTQTSEQDSPIRKKGAESKVPVLKRTTTSELTHGKGPGVGERQDKTVRGHVDAEEEEEEEEEEGIEEREDFPPYALKQPSPLAKQRFSSTISPAPSLSPSANSTTPPPPSPPSPSPTARKRARTGSNALERNRQTSPSPMRRKSQMPRDEVPEDQIQPSTSSPSQSQTFKAPLTPPRAIPLTDLPVTPKSLPHNRFGGPSPSTELAKSPFGSPMAARRPGGMRRMLTKTQSLGIAATSPKNEDASLDGSSSTRPGPSTPSKLARTQSLPESPAKVAGMEVAFDPTALLMPAAVPLQEGSGGRAKRTYGKSRSYLAESSQATTTESKIAVKQPDVIVKESYEELRRKYEVDNSGLDGPGSGNLISDLTLARAPQTVSDMRSKGENRRFMDELGYLIEGITDPSSSINSKRSSAVDILQNMQEESWRGRMSVCGQTERIWEVLSESRDDGDEVLDIVCLLFLRTISATATILDALLQLHASSIVHVVLDNLKVKENVLVSTKSAKITAAVQRLRETAHELVPSNPHPPHIASTLLLDICSKSWDIISADMSSSRASPKILRAFSVEVQPFAARFELYEKGLDLLPVDGHVVMPHILNIVRVISRLVLASQHDREDLVENRQYILDDLVACLIASSALSMNTDNGQSSSAGPLIVEILQLLANLINVSPSWSSGLVGIASCLTTLARIMLRRDELRSIRKEQEQESMSTETSENEEEEAVSRTKPEEVMCLILAILTTVCVNSVEGTEAVAAIAIGESCTGSNGCLRQCRCPAARPFPHYLIAIYEEQHSSVDEAASSVITGYLALLLARIATKVSSARAIISSTLPGRTARERLQGLMVSLSELRGLQSLVQRKLMDMSGEGDFDDVDVDDVAVEDEADVVQTVSNELTEIIQTM